MATAAVHFIWHLWTYKSKSKQINDKSEVKFCYFSEAGIKVNVEKSWKITFLIYGAVGSVKMQSHAHQRLLHVYHNIQIMSKIEEH